MGILGILTAVGLAGVYSIVVMQGGIHALYNYLDVPSLLLVLLWTLPVLLGSGMGKDFLCAFRRAFSAQTDVRREDLVRSMEAVSLVQKALWIAGVLGFSIAFIYICSRYEEMGLERFLANVAVSAIVLVYAALLNLILLAVYGRLKKRYMDYMREHGV